MGALGALWAPATEWSVNTLAATAALTGTATLALINDIAARSGSASPARSSSSSLEIERYSAMIPPCEIRRRRASTTTAKVLPLQMAGKHFHPVLMVPLASSMAAAHLMA